VVFSTSDVPSQGLCIHVQCQLAAQTHQYSLETYVSVLGGELGLSDEISICMLSQSVSVIPRDTLRAALHACFALIQAGVRAAWHNMHLLSPFYRSLWCVCLPCSAGAERYASVTVQEVKVSQAARLVQDEVQTAADWWSRPSMKAFYGFFKHI
jgi:hypothetical protein